MNTFILWYILIMYPISLISTMSQVGKPRQPITPGFLAAASVMSVTMIVLSALVLFGGK